MMNKIKTADAIIEGLENSGIKYIFGVPGEENLDVLEAIRKSKIIKFILTRHEQEAGFMAATIGRLTGIPGVALSTLGPGATNLVTAAAYAQLGGMPLLMLTGQKPIRESKQGAFQIIDVVDMMKPITKFSKQLVEGSFAFSYVREAIRLCTEERPGAVLLEIPEDIAAENIDYKPIPISEVRRPIAAETSINKIVELLVKAKRPLVVVGAGANRKRTSNMLTDLITKFNIPFVNTQMGKGVICESFTEFAGTAALSQGDYVHQSISKSDLIINVGHDIVEKPPFIMQGARTVVHINFAPAIINEIYYPQYEVVGDIANAISQLNAKLDLVKDKLDWDTRYHLESKRKLDESFAIALKGATTITPQVLVSELRNKIADDGIVTLDNGMYKIWFARHYCAKQENTLLLDNALATMGAGLPSAIAAKLVHPNRQVVAVVGDGGFMMNSQALATALALEQNLTVIILEDNSYQMIRWKQHNEGLADFGLTFNNPNFVDYAKSYGANAICVSKPKEFVEALEVLGQSSGVNVIVVKFDYSNSSESLKISNK